MKPLSLVILCALVMSGCAADFAEQSEASVILRITKITATSGHDDTTADFLLSDVDPIFNDNATLEFELLAKNPNNPSAGQFNDVMVEQYEVRYVRSDGRNTEGVDVPYRITGGIGTLVPVGASAGASIIVVRHQAKFEPPLSNLRGLGGAVLISVTAEITVYGHTTSGKPVQASGRLAISFGDYANT